MIVVQPDVSLEKVQLLLREGAESEHLDYKRTIDFNQLKDRVELAKDIAAIQSSGGGYIVFGADSAGRLTGEFPEEQIPLLDEATLRNKLSAWIPEPYEMLSAYHRIDGLLCSVIYLAPRADGFCILDQDGAFQNASGRTETAFRAGDVMVRHGSASERWRQTDQTRIRQAIRDAERAAWQAELAPVIEQIRIGATAQTIARGPISALTWRLDDTTFRDAYLELLRAQDEIPITLMLERLPADARDLMHDSSAELPTLLDRLASFLADMLFLERLDLLDRGLRVALAIYDGASAVTDQRRRAGIWLEVVSRIEATGGVAVRLERWAAIRALVLQHGRDFDFERYGNWIRHALTNAARSDLFVTRTGTTAIETSMVELALSHAMRVAALNRGADRDTVLDGICQFDFLACVVAMDAARSTDDASYYTNFARFDSKRTESIERRLVTEANLRGQVFAGSDPELAQVLTAVARMARTQFFNHGGWSGFRAPRVLEFIAKNRPQ